MFKIDSKELIDYSLALQRINDVSLPFAVQNTLNAVARDVKLNKLLKSANEQFDVKKPNFFKANSAYKPYKANQFGYNINKMHADVGIVKGKNPKENATEQLTHQEIASPIKRSINPLGNKPLTKKTIDILSKKPQFFRWTAYEGDEGNRDNAKYHYIRMVARAKKNNTAFVSLSNSGTRGYVYKVNDFRLNKNRGGRRRIWNDRKTRRNHPEGIYIHKGAKGLEITDNRKHIIELENIASYKKGGHVKLNKKSPFLTNAVSNAKETMNKEFIKQAEKQFALAMKRKN